MNDIQYAVAIILTTAALLAFILVMFAVRLAGLITQERRWQGLEE